MLLRTVKLLLVFTPLFTADIAYAHKQTTREEYIALHRDDAVRDMLKTGVPASITLAQALLESEDGNSTLAREANNHFGIKCTSDWTGPSFTKDDDRRDECFRKYKSVLDSYDDHSYFLKTRPRYAFLFDIKKTDYKQWAKGLKKSGYATNPHYADQLIKIIEDFQLDKLDTINGENLAASASRASGTETASADNRISVPADQSAGREENNNAVITPADAPHVVSKPVSAAHKRNESNTVDLFSQTRTVMKNNGVPYIMARKGDTYDKIAKEYEMMPWLIYKYNDVPKNASIAEGQIIYIKPKHRSADAASYTVKEGDTMQSISQQLGIKMKMLYKRNNLEKGTEPKPGQKLWVNNNKP